MATKTIDIHAASADLAALALLANSGTEVILADAGAPVARIVPITSVSGPRIAGLHSNAIQTGADFDEPLPDAFWLDPS